MTTTIARSANLSTTKQTLVIIDPGIDDHQLLAQGILPTAEVVILDKYQDGIAQISALINNRPVASLQIIAHGSPGSLQLGNSQLNLATLHTNWQQLQQWQATEILIYGCEVAADDRGKTFIEKLHQLTGANIAASTRKIGNAQRGGTWELEVNIGQITTTLALQPKVIAAYPGVFPTFATTTNFTVGSTPRFVTVGDFNGDGKLDLVAVNQESSTISVLIGNGTGGFAPATTFTVGSNPYSVAVGDFNKDSYQDLAVTNYGDNNVSILLGNGTGGFSTPTNFAVGTTPFSVAVGDFNSDGYMDLAVANFDITSNSVSVLLGNDEGGFSTPTNFSVGFSPGSVAVEDFNGDGKLDLITTNQNSNTVSVLLGDGAGGFATATNFSVGTSPRSVAIADFNGDGKLDLAVANFNSNNISVLLGNDTGGFSTLTNFTVGTNPRSVKVGDFNGDGKLDLAVANFGSNTVSVLLGDGTGSFDTATNFTVGSVPFSLVLDDFNSDGKLDLATANSNSNNVSVRLNIPKITITSLTNPVEGITNGSFSITLDTPAPVGGLVVKFNANGSTATLTDDYTLVAGTNISAVTADTFTIEAGKTSATLVVTTVADAVDDPNETITINLLGGSNYVLNTNPSATLTIVNPGTPVITLPSGSVSYAENAAATVLDLGAIITDDNSTNFNTGNLTVRFSSGGTADDRLSIRNQGTAATEINLDGREIYYGSIKIGNFSGGIGTENLIISLNANATIAATQALLRNITFANTSQNPATANRTVEIVLTDETGKQSASVTKTVQVSGVNDAPSVGNTLVLYDGSTGKLPQESGAAKNAPWFAYQFNTQLPGANAATSIVGETANLKTNENNNTFAYAGYTNYDGTSSPVNNLFPTLDRDAGFVLSFGLQVNTQSLGINANKNGDNKTDRAGFSVIVLGQDKKGIELGFLTDRIFAQDDGTTQKDRSLEPDTSGNIYKTLFTQAEGVNFNTTTKVVNYDLAILGDYYTLFADGVAQLTGKVRDYTAAVIPAPIPDVYEKPNFLFFGDNTPSAGTNSNLAFVKVTTSGGIPDQTIDQDTSTAAIPFAIADFETAANNLIVTASSSNPDLIPNSGIVFAGTGSDQTITVTPATGKFGQATITLNVSDGNQTTTRTFVVNVKDVNDNPTDLALSKTDVDENVAAGTVIGDFSTTDLDPKDTFTYILVDGEGATDNGDFTIEGNSLKIKASPDFENKSTYNIRVQTKDAGGETFEKPLTITINDVNEQPTDLTLSTTDVDENVAAETVIGTFSTTDPDAGDTFTYSLVDGEGATDNSDFTIDGDTLKINASPDFETKSSYNIRVQTKDAGGLTAEKALTITINNLSESSTDFVLSASSVDENVDAGTAIGTFSSIDTASTYSLVDGEGATDNSAFTIDGDTLKINASPDFETKSSYNIRVQTEDANGLTAERQLTITINDLNEQPTNLTLSKTDVDENVAAETVIGTFSTIDPDTGDTFTYSLVDGEGATDNSAFTIDGDTLKINASPDFEAKSSYNIRVQTKDAGGLTAQKALTITINNVSESSTDFVLSASSVDENVEPGTVIGTLSTTDSASTYSLVEGDGATDNSAFTIEGNSLKINASPDFEAKSSYNIRIQTEDANGLAAERPLTITINDVNEKPTDLTLSKTDVDENVAAGTVIGTFSTIDPDQEDTFTYALVAGDDDDDNTAFTIDGNSLKIKNSPDFQTKSSYKIRVQTTDKGNLGFEKVLTINVNDPNNPDTPIDEPKEPVTPGGNVPNIPSRLTNIFDDVFNFTGSADVKVKLQITLTERNSSLLNELGLFTVDDAKGTIKGIAPGAAGYAQAALERSKVIFSTIANSPNGFNANNLTSLLELNSGDNLRFLMVRNGTLDAVRTGAISISELLFSSVSTQKITALGGDEFSLAWKDGSGNSTTQFNSLVVKIKQTDQAAPLGTSLQGKSQGEVIDLRGVTQAVKAEFSVHREAAYDNFVGFYRVADENGGIDTNGDGVADLLPGQAGYTQAAVRGRVAGIDLAVGNQGTATFTGIFQPGSIFAPFIIVNGRPDALLDTNANNDPAIYFPYLGANADKSDHIRLLGNNVFGFEDLPNGGDKDFNDLIVKVNLTATT